MNKQWRNSMVFSLCLLSAGAAMADDVIWGAVIGGGTGALVGRSIGGRDGTIIGGALGAAAGAAIASTRHYGPVQRVEYYAPEPAYYAAPVYTTRYYPEEVYYSRPVRIAPRPVYYVQGGNGHNDHWRGRGYDKHRRGHPGWDGRR